MNVREWAEFIAASTLVGLAAGIAIAHWVDRSRRRNIR